MAEWRQMLEVNLLSVVRGCRLFLPGMLAAGRGQIISTASFAGLAGAPGMMTYGVAKAAVVALSEQLRAEVHGKGIRGQRDLSGFLPHQPVRHHARQRKPTQGAGRSS